MNLYSKSKVLSHLPRIIEHRPVYAKIGITNLCDYNCSFCINKTNDLYKVNKQATISYKKLKTVAMDLKQLGIKAITLGGAGEPLCHPEFVQISQMFLENGFEMALVSNGSKLNSKIAKLLSNFTWVRFSINAYSKDTYCKVNGASSVPNFDKYIPVIQTKGCVVGASFVVVPDNKHEISTFKHYVHSIGFDNCKFFDLIEQEQYRASNTDSQVYWNNKDRSSGTTVCYYSELVLYLDATGLLFNCCHLRDDQNLAYGHIDHLIGDWRNRATVYTNSCPTCIEAKKNMIIKQFLEDNKLENKFHGNFV